MSSNRNALIVGNWKLNHSLGATVEWLTQFSEQEVSSAVTLGVAPPFTSLAVASQSVGNNALRLVGQNCHWEIDGAFTGEVSAEMLADAGCTMVILGHSERRQLFSETDRGVGKKVAAAHRADLTPIICVGETEQQRSSGRTEPVIESQLRLALEGLDPDRRTNFVVAYEPVWAIGTGKVATVAQAESAHRFLRQILASDLGPETAEQVRILYGGSVKPDNATALSQRPDIDGFLVGGASLKVDSFLAIAKNWSG